jgi:hypothetical protein
MQLDTSKESVMENLFEMEPRQLVNRLMDACARAGIANSGLCIDITAGIKIREAHLLKAAILAKMEGVTPPFKTGDRVRVAQSQCFSAAAEGWEGRRIAPEETLTVRGVFYKGNGGWLLEFKEIPYQGGSLSNVQYMARCFEKVSEK